jgi:restriction system protein
MARYWIVAPTEAHPEERFESIWQFDLTNNLISIGWSELGDVSRMSKAELGNAVAAAYSDRPSGTKGLFTNMIWDFYHEMSPGDTIIARRGLKTIVGIGKVGNSAIYSPGKNPNIGHRNFLNVVWDTGFREKKFSEIMFLRPTITKISEAEFQSLLSEPLSVSQEEIAATEDFYIFGLEKHLEDFIVSNFQNVFRGRLQIYEDQEGNGQQYKTEIGPIDILAFEPSSNSYVVIELKRARPSDQVIGQVLRYMGWVKSNLCKEGQTVKGLVICNERDPKLTYALSMTQGIDVRYYRASFELREQPGPTARRQ